MASYAISAKVALVVGSVDSPEEAREQFIEELIEHLQQNPEDTLLELEIEEVEE